jgi:A/G-specific adenine glycosylase
VYYIAGAIEDDGRFLLVQRPETGLLAKMWHFPLLEVDQATYTQLLAYWQDQQLTLDAVAEEPAPIFPEFPVVWQKGTSERSHISLVI